MIELIVIEQLGGRCPVQAEGTICGVEFYFKARGERWSLSVGGDVIAAPTWRYEEPFGTFPDAGWMEWDQAEAFLRQAAARYIKEHHPDRVAELQLLSHQDGDLVVVAPSLPGGKV